ncbi:GNAT family N-acetyltransferase [Aeromicrobium tamlense]|uniref:RimJ/RimL family protein N-acetyltransferase n=1 Tax=Aeromicrobium tamlense TaxID=375541 RepID=A0ABX2SK91_9ACTN|nr:GNAT family N-acetyltransferase [Aeromicrobium tamlense]NYI37869.1 RimJ/RimL family protein N-acetyltransferase [Aeromicrobium tamlense]
MGCTEEPWTSVEGASHDLSLVRVPRDVLRALGCGDLESAERLSGIKLTTYIGGPDCRWLWALRADQIARTPADHVWVTRLVVDQRTGAVVGLAGFHGAPDERGMVELGYRIDPDRRRLGHARAALEIILDVARGDPRVAVVRATVSPDNRPSRALLDQYGFVEVGEQWDEEDGLETILEIPA